MSEDQKSIPKYRTASLLSMAAKVALRQGSHLLAGSREDRIKKMVHQAEIIVKHVGLLKGAAMKAIQMLTIDGQDFLPPEVIRILEKLQSQAPPIDNGIILETLKKEIGEDKFSQISFESETPIAAASIGQVYSASIDNQSVIIKVQYPGVAESVDSDLQTLETLIKSLIYLFGKNIDTKDLFAEIERVLKMETNYLLEAESAEKYRELFQDLTQYQVPRVFRDYTTRLVIAEERMGGLEFSQWLAQSPSCNDKEKVARMLLDLFMYEFFRFGLVQTDPNPANFLITADLKIALIDFGATISYEKTFVSSYKELLTLIFDGSDHQILGKVVDMGFLSEKESDQTNKLFVEFLKLSMRPFKKELQPFDFSEAEYSQNVRTHVMQLTKSLKYSPPPKKLFFLHRKLGGIFLLLRQLGVQIDLSNYRDIFTSVDIVPKENK